MALKYAMISYWAHVQKDYTALFIIQLNTAGKSMGGVSENLVKSCNKALNEPLDALSCADYLIKITSKTLFWV